MPTKVILMVIASLFLALNSVNSEESPSENQYLAFWKSYFRGQWTVEILTGESEGRIATGTKGTWSCKLAPAGTCMYLKATKSDGRIDYSAIAGYDASTDAWKEVFFMSDGSHLIQYYSAKPGQLAGNLAGKVIKGTAKYIHPDGTTEEADIQITVIDHNKCEYVAIRRVGDKKLPTLKTVMSRKTK